MARIITAAATAAAAVLTAGCASDGGSERAALTPYHNPSLSSVNEPVVQRTDYVFDVAGGGGLTQADGSRLDAWFQSLQIGYGDRISLDGGGYTNPDVSRDVARIAGAYGLLLSEGAPVTAGQIPLGSVRVIVSRTAASVAGCPMWDDQEVGARVTTSPNYGCATNSNLAAMIANPSDLVVGQTGSATVDAATASKAISIYRKAAPSGGGGTTVKAESSTSAGGGQ